MGQQTSAPKITPQDRAVFQLKQQRDKLHQYQVRLNLVIDRQTALAKEAVRQNNPDRAKVYLRAKKQQQLTISKTYDQLDTLETLIGTIEFKVIEKDVVYGLEQGNAVLRRLNAEMSVDRIDKVMDDLEEERVHVEEVLDILGGVLLTNGEETEVDEELARLEMEMAPKRETEPESLKSAESELKVPQKLADMPTAPEIILPDAPTHETEHKTPNKASEEEKEVEEEKETGEPILA